MEYDELPPGAAEGPARSPAPPPRRRRRRWPLAIAALALLLLAVAGAAWWTCGFGKCPDVEALARFQPRAASLLLDRHGTPFAQLSPVTHRVVRLHEMPNHVPEAFLAAEDQRFHQHGGIDWRRVGGAFLANVRAGEVEEGASTVTMQLARNLFPRALPAAEREIDRKLLEMRVAQAIESRYSKAEILELYVNHIYFGNGARGIAAGARHYFRREPAELTLAQAALLAALPRAPSRYDPRRHPETARERRDVVLGLMAAQGRVAEEVVAAARAEPLGIAPPPREPGPGEGPWFAAQVREALEEELGAALWEEPIRVWTTLDLPLQQAAEQELRRQLAAVEAGAAGEFSGLVYAPGPLADDAGTPYLQGAIVVLDAAAGDVLAWVGGRDFAQSAFDRAADARRQPGSAFKPFVYAAAIEAGHHPSELLDDSPLRLELAGGEAWEPRNPGGRFAGPISLREALVQSKNAATVRLAREVGHQPVAALTARAGMTTPMPDHPAAALGAGSTSPVELAAAYTAFAGLGTAAEPRFVLRVERADGTPLLETQPRRRRVLDPAVAYLTVDVLRDALERGTGAAVRLPGGEAAGKTGTSDGGADAWFVGFTPRHVGAVWIGFDEPRPIAPRASGGLLAAPVWAQVMRRAGGGGSWARPEGVVERAVDPRTGVPVGEGCGSSERLPRDLFLAAAMPPERCPGAAAPPQLAEAAPGEDFIAVGEEAVVTDPAARRPLPPPAPTPAPPRPAERIAAATPPPSRPEPPAAAGEAVADAEPTEAAAGGLDGWWELTTRVDSSSVPRFEGLELGYRLHLRQEGARVSGTGEKWSEAGARLPRPRRTPIVLSGSFQGDRLVLTFTEQGARRASAGTLTLRREDRRLVGAFRSDAAASRGGAALRPLP